MKKYLLGFTFLFFTVSIAMAAPFDKDVPYQDAVPTFLTEITTAVESAKDPQELDDITQWEESSRERLPEFLSDLVTIAQKLETQGAPEFIFDEYTAFAQKWNQIAADYPGLNELDPLLSPLIDELLAGLPALGPPSSNNPLSGLADLYQALEIEDPWGLGGLFLIDPLPQSNKEIRINEILSETKKEGVKNKKIISRETVATVNGVVVYFELINNGQVVQRFVNFRDPSIVHETLNQMIQNNEDPAIVAAVQDIVALIDLNLADALDSGVLDECSYSFIYRKINTGMLENCLDKFNNSQDFIANSRFDPFDDVNQVKLSEPEQILAPLANQGQLDRLDDPTLTLQKPQTGQILSEYQKGLVGPAQTFMVGIVFPAYLFSLFGIFKGI